MSSAAPDVLIVGGGPVGLTLAIELGRHQVRCELIDKRPEQGKLPKMERCNARTMENFRRLGIADEIRAAGLPDWVPMDVFICVGSVMRPPLVHHRYPSVREARAAGRAVNDGSLPLEPYQLISQYTLEPVLRRIAEQMPCVTVRFGQELVSFTQHPGGVVARIADLAGRSRRLETKFLVGCDGGTSTVRQQLGIPLAGESRLQLRQGLFRCPGLFERIPRKGRHYHFADRNSSFLILQDDMKHFSLHAAVSSDDEMPRIFESVIGLPLPYETLYVGTWTQRLMLADRYRDRRVFLAGDAAHLVIPTGGLGMNTGAGDATDLAWKLAGVLQGWGGPGLLDAYEQERRPVGERALRASRKAATGRERWRSAWTAEITDDTPAGIRARRRLAEVADREQRWSNDLLGIELGYRYRDSQLIVGEPGDGPDPDSFRYVPTTWPGARIPHIWLDDGTPLQDHLGRCYTLLHKPRAEAGLSELASAFARRRAPFATFEVRSAAADVVHEGYPFVLVRPDLHVAWRGTALPEPEQLVARVTGHGAAADGQMTAAGTQAASPRGAS